MSPFNWPPAIASESWGNRAAENPPSDELLWDFYPPGSHLEGDIRFQGQSILSRSPGQLRKFRGEEIALIFQDPMTRLNPLMTIGDHCIETLQAHRPKLRFQDAKTQALNTLEAVKIPRNRWSQYPHEFSGGMRQRVAISPWPSS